MKSAPIAAALLLLAALCFAQETPTAPKGKAMAELKSTEQIASYGIGLDMGMRIKNANPDVEALIRGIRDALSDVKPAVSQTDLKAAMEAFGKNVDARIAGEAKKEGAAYLAANGKKEGVTTTASGLQYKVLKSGDGASPKKTNTVRVHYHGTFPDGRVFDSSVQRKEPAEFPVSKVIAGWTEALQLMKVGDKFQLVIPSDLAYGPDGRMGIPPNQVLLFDVELLKIVD